ncbi:hypothetical protein P175DRAFT_0445048 [Aspergillus ochraceoroseus IBT 24754]|uniref:RING-CH-type domain-containing protein n=2 Tax=Aspergillus ochraceoroseus TaxID=138278 RepID=A0A2T5LNL1_9EURO|nr:uncharacterized protein P175DRAFT_0445048 [Aspergillus ochraceoroseus IBT 24754]KKK24999.1 hypothetical protein AOCH_003121 [Aspergillus ochraceoroseus]PTU17878.1 hypothetical protein P175DRAFT_0445048 [Aspergillus ochraceoroseus IBT 24754]
MNRPTWQWSAGTSPTPTASRSSEADQPPEESRQAGDSGVPRPEAPKKHYPPRVCRICLESVPPTFVPPSENIPGFLQREPRIIYESSDPELGRLLRPCKCKGSARYVHEGCLQTWRHADPGYGKRNYWNCPTCGFRYRLGRLAWSRWISSTVTQIFLTFSILILTVFVLGFIADPIINLYVDPMDTIYYAEFWEVNRVSNTKRASWFEHFVKGVASLGLLSFVKVIFAMSPWHWFNIRSTSVVGGRRNAGRNRVASLSWIMIVIGVGTFLWAVYKGVRAWSRRTLEKASERVLDVPLPDDDDDDDGVEETGRKMQ